MFFFFSFALLGDQNKSLGNFGLWLGAGLFVLWMVNLSKIKNGKEAIIPIIKGENTKKEFVKYTSVPLIGGLIVSAMTQNSVVAFFMAVPTAFGIYWHFAAKSEEEELAFALEAVTEIDREEFKTKLGKVARLRVVLKHQLLDHEEEISGEPPEVEMQTSILKRKWTKEWNEANPSQTEKEAMKAAADKANYERLEAGIKKAQENQIKEE